MYTVVVQLLQPHTLLFLAMGAAPFRLWRQRREPHRRLWPLLVPLFLLAVLSTPATAYLANRSLESYSSPTDDRPADAEAIVVLSAGIRPPKGLRMRPEMDDDTFLRCQHAARLYHQGPPCLVMASGGRVDPDSAGPPFAVVMGDFLEQLGVKKADLVLEENSRTTYENAVECARLLKQRNYHRVALVVDAVDMFRAAACFRKQGIEVIPAPCHFRATHFRLSPFTFLPSPDAAVAFERVWHEWLGIVWYGCQGRI